jgi:hypothetical protein
MMLYNLIFFIQKGTPFSGPINAPKPNNNISSGATPQGAFVVFIIILLIFLVIFQTKKSKK